MKKVLSSILISFIIFANILAPFSVGFDKNKIEISKNEASAEYTYSLKIIPTLGDKYIKLDIEVLEKSDTGDGVGLGTIFLNANLQVRATVLKDGKEIDNEIAYLAQQVRKVTINLNGPFLSSLDPGTPYKTKVELVERLTTQTNAGAAGGSGSYAFKTLYETTIDTPTVGEGKQEIVASAIGINGKSSTIEKPVISTPRKMPACGIGSGEKIIGCIAQAIYYVVFVPTSYLFALAGVFFDSTFAYSVQDSSYRSAFVVEGWGLVRDICNMFFIFVLLYVAIATTLSLNSVKTKETIINVIIIGLFINFSLFAAQLIIDASNITARVFYNADTIVIDTKDGANVVTDWTIGGARPKDDGVISLSAGFVNKVNPQNIVLQSQKITNIEDKGGSAATDEDKGTIDVSSFILITLIASAVNIVGFIVFLTVGMMFIARVIGLWIAMIIAPLAFFTYILPEQMGSIKMIGWKNWWPDTLKLAFLAPVFIFFLYLILKFLELDLIADTKKEFGLTWLIGTLMPFAFIMLLLMKAKKIATDMAGEFGEMATKAGSAVGGFALGGAVGLGAMAMRGTLGKMGDKLANSKMARQPTRFGAMVKNIGTKTAASTFDVRNTKAGAAAGKGLGVDMGKAKEGGYTKHKEEVQKKAEERAKQLEVGHNEHLMHELHDNEEALQNMKNENAPKLNEFDAMIKAKTEEAATKSARAQGLEAALALKKTNDEPISDQEKEEAKNARKAAVDASNELKQLGEDKANLKKGILRDPSTGKYNTTNGNITKDGLDKANTAATEDAAAEAAARANETSVRGGNGVMGTAETERVAAEAKATQDETDATTSAANIKSIAMTKAAQDEVSAVEKAKKIESDAITAAATADMAAQMNGTQENKDAAKIARDNANKATANLKSVESNAMLDRAAAETKANQDESSAKAAASAARIATETKAVQDERDARTAATAAKSAAMAKAAQDESEAIQKAENARISATAKNTASQQAAADARMSASNGGVGKSMFDLEVIEIPKAKEAVAMENYNRRKEFANNVENRWFNKEANKHASHNIRMGSEVKTEGGH